MKIKLKAFTEDSNDIGRHYRFAVIDLDRSRQYPANFICILPTVINNEAKLQNAFSKIFGGESLEQAKLLLNTALKNESEREVKTEIRRRLTILDPKKYLQQKCTRCGIPFHPRKIRKFKNSLCEDCFKKKYGHRAFVGS